MSRKALLDAALGLSTVGGAVFAVGASRDPVSKVVTLPDSVFGALMVVGGVLVAVGATAFMLSFLIDRIDIRIPHYVDHDSKYLCTHARLGDLPCLFAWYTRYFGDDVPDIEVMRAWVAKCGSAFTIVQRVVEDSGLPTRQELVGSFKLLPLTAKGG